MAYYDGRRHHHAYGNPNQQNSFADADWQQTNDTPLKSLENGSCSQNTKALICPCISFGNIVGHLQGSDKLNTVACNRSDSFGSISIHCALISVTILFPRF